MLTHKGKPLYEGEGSLPLRLGTVAMWSRRGFGVCQRQKWLPEAYVVVGARRVKGVSYKNGDIRPVYSLMQTTTLVGSESLRLQYFVMLDKKGVL